MFSHTVLLAQDAAAATPPAPAQKSLLSYIADGGFLSYVLVCLSFVAVTVMVRMILVLRRDLFTPDAFLREATATAETGNLQSFSLVCSRSDSFSARVLLAGLRRASISPLGMLDFNNGAQDELNRETERLHRMNDAQAILAAVAPMLGLLGTVIGMIGAFAAIATLQGAARSNELARFMSMALVCTAEGLAIAIPATIAFGLCRRRIESLVDGVTEAIEPIAATLQRLSLVPRSSGGGVAPASLGMAPRPAARLAPQPAQAPFPSAPSA